jgi:glycosyltransferase involved in cell wall biosynthesis
VSILLGKNNMICLDSAYSTTRQVTKEKPVIDKQADNKYEPILFLPEAAGRQGIGGLRTQGYFKATFHNKPLITIITVVFNGAKYLEETILSILNQSYDNAEYIIIDGGSTDGTLDIIKKYQQAIDYWVSEKDNGISDAFNKGVLLSSGDYINFQGDGDGFYTPFSLEKVTKMIGMKKNALISGKICRADELGAQLYISKQQKSFDKKSLLLRMSLPHQGLFTSKKFFKKYGLFDVNNVYCMDYEHLLRAYSNFPEVIFVNEVIANWRADGLGNGKTLDILKEYDQIKKTNKVANFLLLFLIKYLILFKFYLKEYFYRG